MSLILHISDLHLGSISDTDTSDDFKSEIVPLKDRETRTSLLKESLEQLGAQITATGALLECVVISGDITYRNEEEGFKALDGILACLGSARPANNKIVVVPGNHDVAWGASDPTQRYKHFITYVRNQGYLTPLLEGIDSDSEFRIPTDPAKHLIIAEDKRWAIIPINSAHYCGSMELIAPLLEAQWAQIPTLLATSFTSLPEADVRTLLCRLRLQDVARISSLQLQALKALTAHVRNTLSASPPGAPVIIAVLHHQLLPVTNREEFKPYEAISNLARLRTALRDNRISVVLHGHKHTDLVYYDHIPDIANTFPDDAHRVLVISAPNVASPGSKPGTICRLISVGPEQSAPTLALTSIPSVEVGSTLSLPASKAYLLWQYFSDTIADTTPIHLIEGSSIDVVYERIQTLFHSFSPSDRLSNVLCRISCVPSEPHLPSTYPEIPDVPTGERLSWFRKIVDWWQKRDFKRLSGDDHFNHGNRIYRYSRDTDQLQSVIDAIIAEPLTSRGVITLIKPHEADLAQDTKFPSFCFAQFIVRALGDNYVLDVLAHFRKQEMLYWWPINIAELALLQNKVFRAVKSAVKDMQHRELVQGSITTVSTIAHFGDRVPYILVPAIDLDLEESPQVLWDMIYAVCWDRMESRTVHGRTWERVLTNLVPPKEQDPLGVPVPVRGVEYLAELSENFARNHDGDIKNISMQWRALEKINREHRRKMGVTEPTEEEHLSWRYDVIVILNKLLAVVKTSFGSDMSAFT